MKGENVRMFREQRAWNQLELASWLNARLGRRYDNKRISRWENGTEAVPQPVATLIRKELGPKEMKGGPALTVAVANQKGGVGKTVSAVNLAILLVQAGHSVLLIDGDPQANASLHVGVDAYELERRKRTLYHALRGDVPLGDVIVHLESGLRVVPSSITLADAEAELMAQPFGAMALRELLTDARKTTDFIVVDCPPNLGQLCVNGITAADTVLIPCQTEMPSVVGIQFLLRTIGTVQRRTNPSLSVLGILPTMFDARLTNAKDMLDTIKTQYGAKYPIFDPIPRSTLYAQANAAATPTVLAAPDVPGVAVYDGIVRVLIAERAKRLEATHVA